LKYIKTRFCRALLSVLKVTQDNKRATWAYVPLQDFTPSSDIDWNKSIDEIDEQLFDKYGLDDKEREFIRTKVKEMK
jgi:type II restriction enzyme